jgi:cyclic-di-GMP-binding protein
MLKFSVPGTDPLLQHTVETRPKAVAEWLDRLPFASPADTAQQLVTALYALNRHLRHALLALYRPVVARAAASLEAMLAESGVPPHAQQRQIGALLRELHIEHSIGYKQVMLALIHRRLGRANPKRMAEVASRLLAALRDIQAACDLTHTPPPAGVWQDMHQLYAFAQASDLADHAVEDAPSASQVYCEALLLALADPPHMCHAELIHTRLYLDEFAGLARLGAAPASQRGFAIQTDGDAAPGHVAAKPETCGLWLDTDALCRHLHETVIRLRTGETPSRIGLPAGMESELSLTLCKRLFKLWGASTQRAFRRFATPGSEVQIVAGVSAIHRLLDQVPHAPQPNAEDADHLPIHDVGPVFSAAPVAVNATDWTVSNDSAAGLALSGTPDAPLNLKVGDALALRAGLAATWSLGVIRWIRMRDASQVELGVERLSPQIQPVWVRPLRGRRKASPEPALLVPGLDTLKQNDRLLLPRHLYQTGMDAELWHAPHQYTLTFGRCLEHTPNFDLIDFTIFASEQP